MNYLLPEEWTTTFIPLQDHCPVSSYDSIAAMVLEDTGSPLDEHFDHFVKTPIGAASLAQVHLATMKGTGQKVAVKLQHPALEEWIPLDLFLTRTTIRIVKFFFPEYDLEWLSNEMESSLPRELDFALEGKNALRTKEYFSKMRGSPLVVPDVVWGIRRILVMENVVSTFGSRYLATLHVMGAESSFTPPWCIFISVKYHLAVAKQYFSSSVVSYFSVSLPPKKNDADSEICVDWS